MMSAWKLHVRHKYLLSSFTVGKACVKYTIRVHSGSDIIRVSTVNQLWLINQKDK